MFYDTFKYLCDAKGISCNKAALEIGLSNATPTMWKKRGLTPKGDTLNAIAKYFNVSVDYLLFDGAIPGSELRKIISAESEKRGIPMDELYRAFNERAGDSIALNEKNVSEFFDSFFGESAKKSPAVSSKGLTEDEKRILEKFRAASEDKRLAAEYVLGLK